MRTIPLLIGCLFVAIGATALITGEIAANIAWLSAVGIALAGLAGLITAVRSGPPDDGDPATP